MTHRLLLVAALLCCPMLAQAAEVRIVVPERFLGDPFVKSLAASKILASAGLAVTLKPAASDAEAMSALNRREAELGVFTLGEEDRAALRMTGAETTLLTRPFLFKSSEEVFLMQDSFLGMAAEAEASRSGLFPLKIWTHSITYLLTRRPVRSQEDFSRLKIAAEGGARDVKILMAAGAAPTGGMEAMRSGEADALATRLDEPAPAAMTRGGSKLYLTLGWPDAGVLAAAPDFWLQSREIEKNAFKAAAEQARAAAQAELTARETAFRNRPDVSINRLDHDAQMELAMRAGGGRETEMAREMALWRKAEIEVHGVPGQAPEIAPAPPAPMKAPALFATDRNDEGGTDFRARFGARRLDPYEMTCGSLGVGSPPAPSAIAKGIDACAQRIVSATRDAGLSKILVLIHGFNTSFGDVAERAVTLGAELNYQGAILAWSWPSEGSAFGYAYDEDSNAWSEPHLVELVTAIAALDPDIRFDFVAHSMGNRILLQMLREFSLSHAAIRIGAAVFAAPDVSQDVFREQMRRIKTMGALRTLYASEYDRAILISESYHKAPRAGSGGANILIANGLESVDAQLGGHSYVFDEPKAMRDFRQIINGEAAAPQRGLPQRAKAGALYWVIEP